MISNTEPDASGTPRWVITDSEGRRIVVGPVAHDAPAAGNPVLMGGVYRETLPAVADLDAVGLLPDEAGRIYVVNDVAQELTALASAARTTTTSSDDLTNPSAKGVILTLDVTAITDTPSITLSIAYKVPGLSATYETLFTAAVAVTAVGRHTYALYPAALTADGDVTEVQDLPLPRTWRVTVTHGDADSITYSVTGCYLS